MSFKRMGLAILAAGALAGASLVNATQTQAAPR